MNIVLHRVKGVAMPTPEPRITRSVDASAWSPPLPEASGFDHLVVETPVVLVRVLIESDLLPQPFGVERPSFLESGVVRLLAERRQLRKLLRDGDLHVMARNALVIRGRLVVDRQLIREVVSVHEHVTRTRPVGRALVVVG